MRTFLLVVALAAMVSADGAHHGAHAHGEHAHGDHGHGETGHGGHAHEDHGVKAKDLSAAAAAPVSSYDVPAPVPAPAPAPSYSAPVAPAPAAPVVVADSYAASTKHVADSYAAPAAPHATDNGYYYYYYPVQEAPAKQDGLIKGIDTPTILIIVLIVVGLLLLGGNILLSGRSFSADPFTSFMDTFGLKNNDLLYYSTLVYDALAKDY